MVRYYNSFTILFTEVIHTQKQTKNKRFHSYSILERRGVRHNSRHPGAGAYVTSLKVCNSKVCSWMEGTFCTEDCALSMTSKSNVKEKRGVLIPFVPLSSNPCSCLDLPSELHTVPSFPGKHITPSPFFILFHLLICSFIYN